jgi:hypothetical protein
MEPGAGVALVEQDFAARHVQLGRSRRDPVDLRRRELLEQGQIGEERLSLDLRRRHDAGFFRRRLA